MAQRQWRSDDTDKWKYAFGDGSDGDFTLSSNTTDAPIDSSCSGTSGTTSLSATNASFAAGQLILIHQTRGTGVGGWELNKIDSYTAGTITLKHALTMTYTDSGDSQAQVLVLKQYNNVTVNSGVTWTAKAWNGDVGGILIFACKGTTTISGQLNANGLGGGASQTASNGGGFRGGTGGNTSNSESYQGEGTSGAGSQTNSANGNGGGGGRRFTTSPAGWGGAGGGGGAGGAAGSTAATSQGGAGGTGGSVVSSSELTTLAFGGGGGGAGGDSNVNEDGGTGGGNGGAGGNGGGIILIISKELVVTGTITADGGQGRSNGLIGAPNRNHSGTGGGGGGGSILLKCANATLGSTRLDALAGAAGSKGVEGIGGLGAAGGAGRIHIDHSGSISGTTSPTLDATLDTTIVQGGGSSLMGALSWLQQMS